MNDLSITEDVKAVIDAIIPEMSGKMYRERFNSITVNEFRRWKSQCG